jgi:hypothetical protein
MATRTTCVDLSFKKKIDNSLALTLHTLDSIHTYLHWHANTHSLHAPAHTQNAHTCILTPHTCFHIHQMRCCYSSVYLSCWLITLPLLICTYSSYLNYLVPLHIDSVLVPSESIHSTYSTFCDASWIQNGLHTQYPIMTKWKHVFRHFC